MKEIIKRYCVAFDILLCLNFMGVVGATFGAAISDGDVKLTVILGAINTVVIILARVSSYGIAEKKRRRRDDI